MADGWVRCPQCGSADDLTLTEVHEEYGETDATRHRVVDGQVIPGSEFYFTPADPVSADFSCPCGHEWRSRRPIGTPVGVTSRTEGKANE